MPSNAQGCSRCRDEAPLDFDFSFAFQPIVDITTGKPFSYEALVRGVNGEGALDVLGNVNDGNRYQFDQACRVKAVTLAKQLGIACRLNINFLPNAVYEPAACIQTTIKAADKVGFPVENIVFEFLESEEIKDREHLKRIVKDYQARGMTTAIDDFGAGFAGLGLLAEYQPDFLKLDMLLIRDVDIDETKYIILKGMIEVAHALNIRIIAEGVETRGEMEVLKDMGVELIQGYYFAKPGFECLPDIQNL